MRPKGDSHLHVRVGQSYPNMVSVMCRVKWGNKPPLTTMSILRPIEIHFDISMYMLVMLYSIHLYGRDKVDVIVQNEKPTKGGLLPH